MSSRVGELAEVFDHWTGAERLVVNRHAGFTADPHDDARRLAFLEALRVASSAFLRTMDVLGAGDGPIHADIASGDRAYRVLVAALAVLLSYVVGLILWEQRVRAKHEAAHLLALLSMEESLRSALAKVLSGFIPICANCKRIREQDDKWTPVADYVTMQTDAKFSHTICAQCREELYPGL